MERKRKAGQPLTKEDLIFLYERDTKIEGFGYPEKGECSDPRIAQLRKERDPDKDILVVFECDETQIARSVDQINESTKAYVGKLEPGIFDRLPEGFKHVYIKFPEERIRRQNIKIGGKNQRELKRLLERNGYEILSIMEHDDFKRSLRERDPQQLDWKKWKLKSPEEVELIFLSVENLGSPDRATMDQIFTRAQELGLELCSPEVGPQFRLGYVNQPINEFLIVGMKPIADSNDSPHVFGVACNNGEGLWLTDCYAGPRREWNAHDQFVFRLRKKASK